MKKTLAAALLAILAVSSLSFAVASASAMESSNHGWSWGMGAWRKNGDIIPFQRSWVRLSGIVDTWEINDADQGKVIGSLTVNARTIGVEEDAPKKAFANVIWRTSEPIKEEGSWSTTFYAARLLEVKEITLESETADLFLEGTWKVVRVSIIHTVTKTENPEGGYTIDRHTETTISPIVESETTTEFPAKLEITNDWKEFTLSIQVDDQTSYELSGQVGRTRMTQMMFNEFKVSEEDTEKVSRVDLKVLTKNYGARPGWGAYDSNMDFNCNYKIDIADLTTVAANVESD